MKTKVFAVLLLGLAIVASCVPVVVASSEHAPETPWLVASNDNVELWAAEILEDRGPISGPMYRRCYLMIRSYGGSGLWCSDLYPSRGE